MHLYFYSYLVPLYSTILYSVYVIGLQARTFTLGLVLAEGPPFVALLAHVSIMLSATAASLGCAVRTLARYLCKMRTNKYVHDGLSKGALCKFEDVFFPYPLSLRAHRMSRFATSHIALYHIKLCTENCRYAQHEWVVTYWEWEWWWLW